MNTKIIKFDINKNLYDTLIAKQGDTKSRFLLFNLLDGSIHFSLENRSVRVYAIKPDGTEVFNDLTIADATKGYCILELTTQMLAVAGTVKLELMVTEEDKKLTSIPFNLEVIKSINSEESVVSTNEFGSLLTALQDVDNWNKEFTDKSGKLEELYTPRLNELGEQLDNKVSFKIPIDTTTPWSWLNPTSDTEVYGGAIQKISIRTNIYSRGIELYNQSGVTDGSMADLTKAKESIVVHHYSDNNVAQLDNVGRSNAILILKNARNSVMAKHNKTGSGDYLRCDRDDEVEGLQNLFIIKPFNWKDESITAEDKWGICMLGRVGGTNKQVTQVPIMMLSKGVSSSEQGEAALYLYSLAYGKECLKLTNSTLSTGALLDINYVSKQANSPAINININGSSPAIQMTNKDRTVPFFRLLRTTASYGNIIEVKNESNVDIFKISGNGKSIFITDSGDGTLRELKIINGALSVA